MRHYLYTLFSYVRVYLVGLFFIEVGRPAVGVGDGWLWFFVESAYLSPGVLVRSVVKGLFRVGVCPRVCAIGEDRSGVRRVLRAGVYGGFGMVNVKVV